MTRYILTGLHILGLLIFSLGQKEEVKIEHNPPLKMNPGDEATVVVELDKSDVQGFAKYQITVDQGLTIESIESAGASFTFNEGKGKFIWMALPENDKFSISYRIKTAPEAQGRLFLESRFSYIYENERKNKDVNTHYINVGETDDADTGGEMIAAAETVAPMAKTEAEAFRTITSDGINQWRVKVEVTKSGISGFAKIEENIPEGYTAVDLNASGAIFKSMDDVIKYIWYDIPEKESVTISYKLLPVMALSGNEPDIFGSFSFLDGTENTEIPIETQVALVVEMPMDTAGAEVSEAGGDQPETAEVVETTPEIIEEVVVAVTPVPVAEPEHEPEPEIVEEVAEEISKTEEVKLPSDGNIVNVPMPEEGVFYRVQIAAGKNNLNTPVFEKLYAFSEGFKLENHKGWFKYTTGYHQVYKAARDDRERIKGKYGKFQGPFVTAYNDGVRISVQEALMVTSQKWVP